MKKYKKKFNRIYNKKLKETIEKRYNILIFIVTLAFIILFIKLFYVQIVKKDYYMQVLFLQ